METEQVKAKCASQTEEKLKLAIRVFQSSEDLSNGPSECKQSPSLFVPVISNLQAGLKVSLLSELTTLKNCMIPFLVPLLDGKIVVVLCWFPILPMLTV